MARTKKENNYVEEGEKIMEEAALITAVRAACGKVSASEELEDTDITREGGWILKRIDEKITDKKLRSFTGVKDEREYSPHDNTVRVQRVYSSDTLESDAVVLGTHHKAEFDPDASEYYLFPSLYAIKLQRRLRGLAALKWEWNHIRRKIIIDPAPMVDGDTYYYKSVERVEWTLAKLPTGFEELLVIGVSWKCLEIVLLKRSDLGGIQRGGGFVDYPAGGFMKDFATDKKDEFFNMLRLKSQLYGVR